MRIDDLKVEYDNCQGYSRAVIRPPLGPYFGMSKQIRRGGSVAKFRRAILTAAKDLAREITEIETGVDIRIDPKAEMAELVEHANLIPSDEWLRRYSLVRADVEPEPVSISPSSTPSRQRGSAGWRGPHVSS